MPLLLIFHYHDYYIARSRLGIEVSKSVRRSGMAACRVVSIESLPHDVSWCFKPLFIWMRVIGIELDPQFENRINLYGLLILLASEWSSVDLTVNSFWQLFARLSNHSNETNYSTTTEWNGRLDHANHFILMSVVSPTLFYIAHTQWKQLWSAIYQCELTNRKFNTNRLRKLLLFGFIPLLVV